MKTMIAVTALLLTGCNTAAEAPAHASNSAFQVERLFTVDGCTVFRFYDAGRSHYFTTCTGGTQSTTGSKSQYSEHIQTTRFP